MQAGEGIAPALPLGHVWAQQLAGWAAGQADYFPQGQVSVADASCPVLERRCRDALAVLDRLRAGNSHLLSPGRHEIESVSSSNAQACTSLDSMNN